MKPKTYLCHDGIKRTAKQMIFACKQASENAAYLVDKNNRLLEENERAIMRAKLEMVYLMAQVSGKRTVQSYGNTMSMSGCTGISSLG